VVRCVGDLPVTLGHHTSDHVDHRTAPPLEAETVEAVSGGVGIEVGETALVTDDDHQCDVGDRLAIFSDALVLEGGDAAVERRSVLVGRVDLVQLVEPARLVAGRQADERHLGEDGVVAVQSGPAGGVEDLSDGCQVAFAALPVQLRLTAGLDLLEDVGVGLRAGLACRSGRGRRRRGCGLRRGRTRCRRSTGRDAWTGRRHCHRRRFVVVARPGEYDDDRHDQRDCEDDHHSCDDVPGALLLRRAGGAVMTSRHNASL
jgi:hypothetical protein